MRSWLKNTVFSFLRLIGIATYVNKPDYHYVPDYFGKSAHKQKNIKDLPVFGELADRVIQDGRISLYYDRLFTIYQILFYWNTQVKSNKRTLNMAEIGVYKGGTSFFISSLAEKLRLPVNLYCFDTFEGHAAEDINSAVEISHKVGTFADTSFESVKAYLSEFENTRVYKGRFQDNSYVLKDVFVDFVHLDMDIYEPTIFALKFFHTKLNYGGVMLLDDYGFAGCPGIEKAVDEFLAEHKEYFGMPLLSGQYIFVKIWNDD